MKSIVVQTIIITWLIACGGNDNRLPAQMPEDVLVDMPKVLADFIRENPNVASITLLAVDNNEILFFDSAGKFDFEQTQPPTMDTLYKTSSIAKLVISIAIMQQVERGLLNLDDDINQYLSFSVRHRQFPDIPITPRMLMQHSAGLSNPSINEVTDELFLSYGVDTKVTLHPLIEEVISPTSDKYRDSIWLNASPNALHKNSNFGMVLLAYLVEKLSGLHYTDYARQNIFTPLAMSDTSLYYPDLEQENIAVLFDDNNMVTPPNANWFYPIGGLYTSPADWANFMQTMLNNGTYNQNQILTTESIGRLLTPITPTNNQLAYDSNIGLIWRQAPINPGWIGHTGAGTQVTHITEINPQKNIGYVVFTNEGRIDGLIGPGSDLNLTIHQWLNQLQNKNIN